ncbi:MAG TPA: hypothetical protein DDW50_02545 [Firmicutes bacterium]|jgi:hypothetical protein|nr:hypothetical protein [Bacillota bacterium]
MHNPYLMFIVFLISYISFFICYQLALTFISLSPPLKQSLLPVLISAVIAYISKIYLSAPAPVHTVVVVILCAGMLRLFNPISFLLSLIGSLLTVITLTLGSMILACPVFAKLGYTIPAKFAESPWLLLNLLELIIPILVLIILKVSKFSLIKYFSNER